MEAGTHEKSEFESPDTNRRNDQILLIFSLVSLFFFGLFVLGVILIFKMGLAFISLVIVGLIFFVISYIVVIFKVRSSEVSAALKNKMTHRDTMEYLKNQKTEKCSIVFQVEASHMVVKRDKKRGTTRSNKKVTWRHEEKFEVPFSLDNSKTFYPLNEYGVSALNLESRAKFYLTEEMQKYVTSTKERLFDQGRLKDESVTCEEVFLVNNMKEKILSVDQEKAGFCVRGILSWSMGWVWAVFGFSWCFHLFYNSTTTNMQHDVVKYCSFHPFELNATTINNFKLANPSPVSIRLPATAPTPQTAVTDHDTNSMKMNDLHASIMANPKALGVPQDLNQTGDRGYMTIENTIYQGSTHSFFIIRN